MYRLLLKTSTGSDNLARCGALENLVNNMADDTWDDKAVNRISAIHFLDEDEDEDDDKVTRESKRANCTTISLVVDVLKLIFKYKPVGGAGGNVRGFKSVTFILWGVGLQPGRCCRGSPKIVKNFPSK